jgi:Vitamin K-dependent gamma-carboxylase
MSENLAAYRAVPAIVPPLRNRSIAGRAAAEIERFVANGADPYALGFFRIAVSLVAIIQVFILWPYLLQLYGNFGFIQWAITEADPDTWLPSIGKLAMLLHRYGVSSSASVHGLFVFYSFSLFGLLIGWKTRLFAISSWLAHALTVNSGDISLYGVDTMIHICLFYCAWMPVGRCLSLDQIHRQSPVTPSFFDGISMRTLQLHLCIIYLSTGLAKAQGRQWWTGEALWRAFMQPQFAVFDMSWLASVPWLAQIACWSVMLIELGYPFLIWPAKTRPIWVIAISAVHLGVGIIMGLWMFSIMMILMTFSAFGLRLVLNRIPPWQFRTLHIRANPAHPEDHQVLASGMSYLERNLFSATPRKTLRRKDTL